jgi:hypothetical protein
MKNQLFNISLLAYFFLFAQSSYAQEKALTSDAPVEHFLQVNDWVLLKSGEWLQGEIISMYYNEVEFDSDKLGMQDIDLDDVVEFRSNRELSVRMNNGHIWDGFIILKNGKLNIVKAGVVNTLNLDDVVSMAESQENELDLWDGSAKLGATLSRGNTSQFDYNVSVGLQRRTTTSRFKSDYTGHYSNYTDDDTNEKIVSADNRRFVSVFDWFINNKFFFRVVDLEIFRDPFLNIDKRMGYSVAVGYFVFDYSDTRWDIILGPSYQSTKFVEVSEGEIVEKSPGLSLTTDYYLKLSKKVDFDLHYQVQWVNEASGDFIHHLEAAFEVDLIGDFEVDLTFYLDRTETPKLDASGNPPKKNDYRLALSLGYNF